MSYRRGILLKLQKLSKGLMAPTAVLPAAALLKRLGAPDILNLPWMYAAGDTIFRDNNLSLLFAIGIAIGMAEENNGIAGLAALVGHLVLTSVAATFDPNISVGILSGLIVGLLAGFLYNQYHSIKLPLYLGFFGGRRFVPILISLISVGLGLLTGWLWPLFQRIVNLIGNGIAGSGYIGGFLFGFCNRMLIPFGLHHVINTVVWFQFGQYKTPAGKWIHGDLTRFFAGDPGAGTFMTGFFPIMLFALPAACLAMIAAARRRHRKAITGMLLSVALTSFLTGITEPIEFLFMFLSPLLYVIHAILTGVSLAVVSMLGIRSGFGFSAGMIDYILNFGISSKPLLLIVFGLGYGIVYYFIFLYAIKKWDIPTPGRLDEEESKSLSGLNAEELKERCGAILNAMGGPGNIESLDACVTRIRLMVNEGSFVDEKRLIQLGAANILKLSANHYQIVVGTMADPIVSHIKTMMKMRGKS